MRSPVITAHVPEVHTDFILVGIATQWGMVGAVAVLGLLSILVCRCVSSALNAASGFQSLLALALATLIGIQAALDFGWHVASRAVDRAHGSSCFLWRNVDDSYSFCARRRRWHRNIRRQGIVNHRWAVHDVCGTGAASPGIASGSEALRSLRTPLYTRK